MSRDASRKRMLSERAFTSLTLAFERWGYDEKGWARSTRRSYLFRVRAAESWMRGRHKSLRWADLPDLREYLSSCPPEPHYRNGVRSALCGFGDFLVAQGLRESNPALELPRLPIPKPLPRALSTDQAATLLTVSQTWGAMDRAILRLYLFSGLRLTEGRMLRWPDLEEGWIRVHGKGDKLRSVPLHPELAGALGIWRRGSVEAEWVFPSPVRRGPISQSYIERLIADMGSAAGIPGLHPHVLRHTLATRLIEQGEDVTTVQVVLGHASLRTTQVYVAVRPQRVLAAVGRLRFEKRVNDDDRARADVAVLEYDRDGGLGVGVPILSGGDEADVDVFGSVPDATPALPLIEFSAVPE